MELQNDTIVVKGEVEEMEQRYFGYWDERI